MNKKKKKMIFVELGLILLVLLIYIIANTNLISLMPKCLIKENLGILCPSCGSTRMVYSFMHFNFKDAFMYNPVMFLFLIYILIVNLVFIINAFRKKEDEILTFLYPKNAWYWVVFVIILIIYTVIRNII